MKAPQLIAFKESAWLTFLREMAAHLAGFAPPLCKTLSEAQMKSIVEVGVARAQRYGFTHRGPIRLFLELMLIFGSGFDEDPQYPWAGETLRRKDFFNQMFKAGRLEYLATAYVEKIQGPKNENAQKALLKLEELAGQKDLAFNRTSLKQDVLQTLRSIFPGKLEHIGIVAAEDIIQRAATLSGIIFGEDNSRAAALLAILKFSFGVKCEEDPFYPWIGATLRDPRITHRTARATRLERKAVTWLKATNASQRGAGLVVAQEPKQ